MNSERWNFYRKGTRPSRFRGKKRSINLKIKRKLLMKCPKKLLVCSCFNIRFTGLSRELPGPSLRAKPNTEHLKSPFCSVRYLPVKLNLSALPWLSLL